MTDDEKKRLLESDLRSFDLFEPEPDEDFDEPDTELRIIRTARTQKEMNEGALAGFRPLLKRIEPSDEIRSKYCVYQEKETGVIKVLCDFRSDPGIGNWEQVIDWTPYYPHHYPNPFAAYLLPPDLKPGERVYLLDLIEDIRGSEWNQGDSYRLDSCEAIWNGEDFEIQFDPERDWMDFIG